MKILIVAGHVGIENLRADGLCAGRDLSQLKKSTGTRGEREWTGDAAQRIARGLRSLGHDAEATDSSGGDDVRSASVDLVLTIHGQRDRDSARAFASAPNPAGDYIDDAALARSRAWVDLFAGIYERRTSIPVTQAAITANMTDLYLWCYVARSSAAVILECGNMDVDSIAFYDAAAMGRMVDAIVEITALWAGGGAPVPPPPPPPTPPASATPVNVMGPSSITDTIAQRLTRYLWSGNTRASIAVPQLYATLAPLAGIRAEIAFAQAMHETGFLTFPRIARPEWHNFAGLGCAEATRICNTFWTDEEGVRAHLGHLLVYFGPHIPAFCDLDQRHRAHRSLPNDANELGGVGRWAPSAEYGGAIAAKARAILAL